MGNSYFSQKITVFHGRKTPEEGLLVGYGAIIDTLSLSVPIPDILSLISFKKRKYLKNGWQVFTPRHKPEDTLYKQLVFALKYEGINLLVLKKIFESISESEFLHLIQKEPIGQYSRRLWFLYEWLMDKILPIEDLKVGNYVDLVDGKIQYALNNGIKSKRHRINNNIPGTKDFCPLVRRTYKLDNYISSGLIEKRQQYLNQVRKDILQRASAFLLLKDSKASFTIEGESTKSKRTARWGKVIGQAGMYDLTKEELTRLQQIVIGDSRFVEMGARKKGGFVGEHDRTTGEPIPDHISARWNDIDKLLDGLIRTTEILVDSELDAVIGAAIVSFGFVFIHPFEDGNGRIHRYLIHHFLAQKNFAQQGVIFPISASMLDHIEDYRKTLESYSHPLLDFIEWKETSDHNVEVLNETKDYYRYFDATRQVEFLYDCVNDTIDRIIPEEVEYQERFDQLKRYLENEFTIPDHKIKLMVRFLQQNNGKISKRALSKEFAGLTNQEAKNIETVYCEIFQNE